MPPTPDDIDIVIVGASGDLAQKKIIPALFALYCQGHLPLNFNLCGFARSQMTPDEFRSQISRNLTCRYAPGESCEQKMTGFLAHCHYTSGAYGSPDSFLNLYQEMQQNHSGRATNTIFYLAIPPSIFLDVARALGNAGLIHCDPKSPAWTRVVIEKPFGEDRRTSDILTHELAQVFTEDQTYRIDHYLGKEVIQNLLVLRFANLIFEPLWNRSFVRRVNIAWQETKGVEGRGGYFDKYGIIRDVMQNHLLQILALVAMDPPASLAAKHIRDEKVKVLKNIHPVRFDNLIIGQYGGANGTSGRRPGYTEDPTVPANSTTPTFAATVMKINNHRWDGVPFVMHAGKAMDESKTEIRILFDRVPGNLFKNDPDSFIPNELVIRVQPDETIFFKINNKVPGLSMDLEPRNLDLRYQTAYQEQIPDAYENLLLDVMQGEKSLFIRSDELAAAWDIFTPVLHEMARREIKPAPYAFGSSGPDCGTLCDLY